MLTEVSLSFHCCSTRRIITGCSMSVLLAGVRFYRRLFLYFALERAAKYCSQRVCVSISSVCMYAGNVCMSVCSHALKNTCPSLTKLSDYATYGRGSVLLGQQCNKLCTSGLADGIIFPHNGAYAIASHEVNNEQGCHNLAYAIRVLISVNARITTEIKCLAETLYLNCNTGITTLRRDGDMPSSECWLVYDGTIWKILEQVCRCRQTTRRRWRRATSRLTGVVGGTSTPARRCTGDVIAHLRLADPMDRRTTTRVQLIEVSLSLHCCSTRRIITGCFMSRHLILYS